MSLPPELLDRVLAFALCADERPLTLLDGSGRLSDAAFARQLAQRAFLCTVQLVSRAWCAVAAPAARRDVLLTSAWAVGAFAARMGQHGKDDVRSLTFHPDAEDVTVESVAACGRLLDRLPALERLVVVSPLVRGRNPEDAGDCGSWHAPYCDPPYRWPTTLREASVPIGWLPAAWSERSGGLDTLQLGPLCSAAMFTLAVHRIARPTAIRSLDITASPSFMDMRELAVLLGATVGLTRLRLRSFGTSEMKHLGYLLAQGVLDTVETLVVDAVCNFHCAALFHLPASLRELTVQPFEWTGHSEEVPALFYLELDRFVEWIDRGGFPNLRSLTIVERADMAAGANIDMAAFDAKWTATRQLRLHYSVVTVRASDSSAFLRSFPISPRADSSVVGRVIVRRLGRLSGRHSAIQVAAFTVLATIARAAIA